MTKRLLEIIDASAGRAVAVIGDVITDEFIYGRLSRVSREAPVLILKHDETVVLPGGAGNAAANVADLGGKVRLVGVVGKTSSDKRMLRKLPKSVDHSGLILCDDYHAPLKTRILAGGAHGTRQQVVRIDRESQALQLSSIRKKFERAVSRALIDCEAVLVSDYGSGLVDTAIVSLIKKTLTGSRRKVPLMIDSRYNLLKYRGVTACTPNESEVEAILGIRIEDNGRRFEKAGRELLKKLRSKGIVITRGSRGMAVFVSGQRTLHIPVFGTDEVADVTGAGDTVIATIALSLAAGASLHEAARLANYAGGLVVMKRGTATVLSDELRRAVEIEPSN